MSRVVTAPDAAGMRTIAARFPGRWLQGYARGKLGNDPVYAAAAAEILTQPAPVLDIGCGIGLFAHYLRAAGCEADYLGIDLDAHKIDIAQRAAAQMRSVRFMNGSCEMLPDWQGHVAMLDVLHYLPADVQQTLLREAAKRVAPGAALIIRSVLRDASWRFRITRLEELFMRSIRWMRYPVQTYPDAVSLQSRLAAESLQIELRPLWGRTPFNSYLIIARRVAG